MQTRRWGESKLHPQGQGGPACGDFRDQPKKLVCHWLHREGWVSPDLPQADTGGLRGTGQDPEHSSDGCTHSSLQEGRRKELSPYHVPGTWLGIFTNWAPSQCHMDTKYRREEAEPQRGRGTCLSSQPLKGVYPNSNADHLAPGPGFPHPAGPFPSAFFSTP